MRRRWAIGFPILAISVVIRGCAIPVAWKVIPAHQEGSWRPYWEGLLNELGKAVPPEWEVIVLADRGLYARWLWDAIRAWGWHPFLRINLGCKARVPGEETFEWISRWVPTPGTSWQGKVECFVSKKGRVNGTLLMHWEPGYESAWVILTDLDPQKALVSWYGLRTWTEGGFKDFKRGLWGWHHSKMQRASSVERLWLAMALAQLWCVRMPMSGGSQAGGGGAAKRAWRIIATATYRPSTAKASRGSTSSSPLELCRSRQTDLAGHAVPVRTVADRQLAGRTLA